MGDNYGAETRFEYNEDILLFKGITTTQYFDCEINELYDHLNNIKCSNIIKIKEDYKHEHGE